MKRRALRLLPLLLLMLFAEAMMAETVDMGRARQAATTFLNNNGAQTRGLTDVTSATGFSNVYVFTTENSFVLMAADDRVQPILGYSLNGRFDIENMPDNKRAWIEEYTREIQYAIEHQTRATTEVTQQWRDLVEGRPNAGRATTAVAPLISTRWDQTSPYNMYCPGGSVTGCVATAMAQIMKFWNYPSHGIGSHSYNHASYGVLSADFQSTTYDWNNMINTYSNSSTNAQKQAVATLMYHCGVSVEMTYSPNASGASTADVAYALKTYFGYSDDVQHVSRSAYSDADWIALLKSNLNQSRPIQYHGSGSGGGHSFVCDGYNDNNYFHFNWGWSGYCDEYYVINNLNPGPGGTGSGTYGIYNDNQGAVVGIHPSGCTANAPTNLTYTQNGRNVTLSWSAATGASSYKVYCNNSFVGNASSTSYTHAAPYGSSVYFVRSVDSQGRLSLSSNAVTVTVAYPTPIVDDLSATVSGKNVNLSWTAPDWCYPSTPTATMTYGSGDYYASLGLNGSNTLYWGHRYLASNLSSYNNMKVYKVSFYANETGNYKVYIYKGTTSGHPQTQLLQQSISVGSIGWFDIDLTNPIQIDASKDLWVFIYDPEYRSYPATYCSYSGSEGNYYSTSPASWVNTYDGAAFLIRTYVSDGTYTYDVYRNGTRIANSVNGTSYSDTNLASGTYSYYLKTNYYGGVTEASNQVTVEIANPTLTLASNANNSSAINAAAGQVYNVVLADRTFYKEGIWNTLCLPFNLNSFTGTPLEGATVKTLASSTYNNEVLTMNFTNALTSIQAGKPYIVKWDDADLVIHSTAEWDAFATNVNDGTQSYQGKVVRLAADISVTTMVGTSGHPFKGTFNGLGHTLTINLDATETYQAPFRYVNGATIKNLTVAGNITTSAKFAAGLVAVMNGTSAITSCVNNVTINSSVNGDGTHGGLVAVIQYSTATITDCLFNGKLLGPSTTLCGGFVGWTESNATLNITNCLFAPTEVTLGIRYTFSRARDMSKVTITNSYYTQAFGELQGTPTTATGAALQALLGDGWMVSGGSVVPKLIVDTIVNPVFTDVTISSATANVTTTYADFIGSYAPFSNSDLLLDANNPNGDAQHAALDIGEMGNILASWYTDAELTTPATAIPFADDGTVTLYFDIWSGEDDEYLINSAREWDLFCDAMQDNATYGRFVGKIVKLGADISVTRMSCSSGHEFGGTFDGQGHTLTVSYQNNNGTVRTAPFTYVDGATIQNLIVAGSITGTASRAAGIVGETGSSLSHVTNCVCSVNVSGGSYTGGISVGGNVEITGCVFNGTITGTNMSGGFVGWSNSSLVICDCLFAPQEGSSISGGTFYYNGGGDITPVNSYYTVLLGTEQGFPAISDPNIQPLGSPTSTYPLSNLTAYVNGLLYGDVFYYAPSITQTVALSAGTNWFSVNVEITLDDLKAALEATGYAPITIQSKDEGLTTYNGTRWRGSLSTLDVTQMYMVTVETACEIELEGMPINPADHPVIIHNGANWIAFPLSESMTITNAFAGFNVVSGDVVNSKSNGLATYTNRWRGTLTTLEPGEGYIYNSAATEDRVLTFPASAK